MFYRELDWQQRDSYRLLGKTPDAKDGILSLPWCDSGLTFRFFGTGCLFHFEDYQNSAVAYIRVWVDGAARRFAVANGKEKAIIEDLPDGVHTVRVLRITEGTESLRISKITLCGSNPTVLTPPAEKPLRLAFIGDSITCGYGVLGPSSEPTYVTYEQDSSRSYAYRTAELLDAEVWLSGASGKGIVSNCNGNRSDMTLRQAFAWETPNGGCWDFSRFQPDLTVINAGTNDAWGGVTDEEFLPVAKQFLQEVRTAFPGKPILWCYGVMDQNKQSVIEQAVRAFNEEQGDAYYLAVQSMHQVPNEVGGGGHPNTNTSERVSALLAEKIREILKR